MKKLLLLIIPIILLNYACFNKKPCDGEPKTINYTEVMVIKFINEQNENIFLNQYNIDSLIIKENNEQIEFQYLNEQIEFQLSSISSNNLKDNYNKEISTNILFQYKTNFVDTILFKIKPVIYPEKCNMTEYYYVKIYYNSELLINNNNTSCIICNYSNNQPLIIER